MFRPRAVGTAAFVAAILLPFAGPPAAEARSHRTNERTGKLVPAFAELVKARKRGDRSALGRLGDRIGPARLAQAIGAADAHVAEAALTAAPLARGGILLVGAVADQLTASDATRATAAAAALGTLLDGAVPTAIEDWDVPPDQVARACAGLRALAARREAPLPARLAALDAMLEATPSCGGGGDLGPLAHDPAPEIRRAAVLAAGGSGRAAILHDGLADGDHRVSGAAAAADCRIEGRVGRNGKEATPQAPALAAARALAAAPTTPPADAVEMLDCLAAGGTATDRALLDQLRQGPVSPLRDRAIELGDLGRKGSP
ncbi:MAG TPA: hypothetical protein VGP64_11080 [Polyangia bacterium]